MDAALLAPLSAVLVLMGLSAFFSGAETALTAAPRAAIHHLDREGNRRARLVNGLRRDKERLIAAILLGNNLVNILASALTTGVLIGLFGEAGVAYATVAMTVLLVVFSEILPKTYALQHSVPMALRVAPAVKFSVTLLSPIALALRAIVTGILRLFGSDPNATAVLVSPTQALRGAIDLHAKEAGGIQLERAMLHSILELGEVEVREIMIHRQDVVMIDIDSSIPEILDQIAGCRYTRIPLWRGRPENIIGVLHAKALLQILRRRRDELQKADILAVASQPWFIPDTMTLLDQLQAFRRRREHFAVVVDEYGAFMGIVTLEDILEEIVGDIADEHDIATPGLRRAADGSVIAEGTVTIRDINRRFDWDLPDEEAATIAGLVLHESRQIPDVGQTFVFHEFRFEVLRRRRNQITLIKITPPAAERGWQSAERLVAAQSGPNQSGANQSGA